jgi:arylsulfatase A-like enzyme
MTQIQLGCLTKIMRILILLLAFNGFLFCASSHSQTREAPDDKPNILFIAIDDLNDWVGPLGGHPQVQTPNMDRLAAHGITFTNAYTNAPSCNPARTALMSGLRPSTNGIYGNYPDWRIVDELKGVAMMPAHFRDNGYRSVGGGKIYHAHTYWDSGMAGNNDPNSWDEFYPSMNKQIPDGIYPVAKPQNGNPETTAFLGFDWYGLTAEDNALADGQVTNWAVQELLTKQEGPRFTAVGIYRPHLPWYVPKKYLDLYPLETLQLPEVPEDDLDDVPVEYQEAAMGGREAHRWIVENDKWKEAVQGYLASISFADAMLGKILDALDESGEADNTIVVLISDHGWQLGHKLRWRKMALWRQSTRIPMIIAAPGITTAGSRSNKPVSLLDLYPTLVDLAGLSAPAHKLEGNNLKPLLENPNARWNNVAITSWGYKNHAVQDEHYRYIRYKSGEDELYDHQNDPNEWTNLANDKDYTGTKNRLAARLPKKNTVGLCSGPDDNVTPPRECGPPARP